MLKTYYHLFVKLINKQKIEHILTPINQLFLSIKDDAQIELFFFYYLCNLIAL